MSPTNLEPGLSDSIHRRFPLEYLICDILQQDYRHHVTLSLYEECFSY